MPADKRALKQAYKQKEIPMGILQIKNMTSGRIFVTSSLNLDGAMNSYRFQLKMGSFVNNNDLQLDWNRYGEEVFTFEVLDVLEQRPEATEADKVTDLKALEQMWLEKLQPYGDRGYNRQAPK